MAMHTFSGHCGQSGWGKGGSVGLQQIRISYITVVNHNKAVSARFVPFNKNMQLNADSWSSFFLFDVAGEISELTSSAKKYWSDSHSVKTRLLQAHALTSVQCIYSLLRPRRLSNFISVPDSCCFNATKKESYWEKFYLQLIQHHEEQ